jgi:hypothetical protein
MALRLSLPRGTSPTVLFCAPHLRRAGLRVRATRVIDNEAFCPSCLNGKPLSPVEKLRLQGKSQPGPPDSNRLRAEPAAVELSVPDVDQNDGIPTSHRLTDLEIKLLNVLQQVMLDQNMMRAAIHRRCQ